MKTFILLFLCLAVPAAASRRFQALSDTMLGPTTALPSTGTVSFLVNPQFPANDGLFHIFFEQYNAAQGKYFQVLTGSDGSIYAAWNNGSVNGYAQARAGQYSLNQNAWNHIAVTWTTGSGIALFLNGNSIATGNVCPWVPLTGTPQSFGNRSTAGYDARSEMAAFGIWSRVLAVNEIRALAALKFPSTIPSGLSSEYDLAGNSVVSQAGSSAALSISGPVVAGDPPPPTPPAIALTGPATGTVGVASGFFVVSESNLLNNTVVTPFDGGKGGRFTPASVTLLYGNASAVFTYTANSIGSVPISLSNDQSIAAPAAFSFGAQRALAFPTLTVDAVNKTAVKGKDVSYAITQAAPDGYPGAPPVLELFNAPPSFSFSLNGKDCGVAGSPVRFFNWRSCGVSATGSYTLTVHTGSLGPGVYIFAVACSQAQAAQGFGVTLTLTVTGS